MQKAKAVIKLNCKQAEESGEETKYNKKLAKMIKRQNCLRKTKNWKATLNASIQLIGSVAFTETKTQVVSHNHIH
ncbi:hypothetical protein O9992_09675 [Vibrio lentus]|nr:hypothetical protein [Vibrio lentus]